MFKELFTEITEITESAETNQIKKGWQVQLTSGCSGVVQDSKKGNIRSILTDRANGCFAEYASFFASDVVKARKSSKDDWIYFNNMSEAKGPGGPQGNFNLSPTVSSGSKEYADAMSSYNDKTLNKLAVIAKKFKAEGKPETMKVSGVAGDGYQLLLYTGKGKGFINTIKIMYYSSRQPWSIVVGWGDKGSHNTSSSSEKMGNFLEIAEVEKALQKLADKMPGFEDGTVGGVGRWNKTKFFPCKWPKEFDKRIS